MKLPDRAQARTALADSVVLALASLVTYLLATRLLSWVHSVSPADDMLGGLWAVIAAIFVNRSTYSDSLSAAVSRMAATFVSFVYCLIYLAFLPFQTWALALLVGVSALTATLIGRPGDAITAAITTTVVLLVAAVSPHGAWEQPILRLADTVIGVAVGVASAWLDQRLIRPRLRPPAAARPMLTARERGVPVGWADLRFDRVRGKSAGRPPTAMAAARSPARRAGTSPGSPRECSGARRRASAAGGRASWPARPLRSGRCGTFR